MDDFEQRRAEFRRSFDRTRRIVNVIQIITFALVFAGIGLLIYLLFHPEQIGAFFRAIVDGFAGGPA